MASIDTVLASVSAVSVVTAATVATGDSATVRSFAPPATARLLDVITAATGAGDGIVRITSPYLHDTTRGITLTSKALNPIANLPRAVSQPLSSQDTLALSAQSPASTSSVQLFALLNYYSDLGASDARLHSLGDFSGSVVDIKPVEVDCTANATPGQWTDAVITTTENLLKANTDYAVLGFVTDVNVGVVAIKGQDTGSLRIGSSGAQQSFYTRECFVTLAEQTGLPLIPVINAANANNTYVSVADAAASTAVKVQVILAELASNLSS